MRDKFATLEDSKGLVTGVAGVMFLALAMMLFFWPRSTPEAITGVVESSGAVSVAKVKGGTREVASVRLSDGSIVVASVASGGLPLSPGDHVTVLKQSRLIGGPAYQVTSNGRAGP